MGDLASERGLGGFARLGSELGSSVDHSCLSAATCWLLACTAGTRGRGPLRQILARSSHTDGLPDQGREGSRDKQTSTSPTSCEDGHPGPSVLFCILNGLDVAGKQKLLKTQGEFGLENDVLNTKAPSLEAVLSYQGCLLSIAMNQAWHCGRGLQW